MHASSLLFRSSRTLLRILTRACLEPETRTSARARLKCPSPHECPSPPARVPEPTSLMAMKPARVPEPAIASLHAPRPRSGTRHPLRWSCDRTSCSSCRSCAPVASRIRRVSTTGAPAGLHMSRMRGPAGLPGPVCTREVHDIHGLMGDTRAEGLGPAYAEAPGERRDRVGTSLRRGSK